MPLNRWEQAAVRLQAQRGESNDRFAAWWTNKRTAFAMLLVLAALVTISALRFNHDAPLRQADLPRTTATVLSVEPGNRRGRAVEVQYRVGSNGYQEVLRWSNGSPPRAGTEVKIGYNAADPKQIRPLDYHWSPGYITLMTLTGCWLIACIAVLVTRLPTRPRTTFKNDQSA